MDKKSRIKAAASFSGIREGKIAEALDMSQASFSKKATRGTFSDNEMAAIAKAVGAEYEVYFRFPDGTRI